MGDVAQVEAVPLDRTAGQRERRPDGTFAPGCTAAARRAAKARDRKTYTPAELNKRLRQIVTPGRLGKVTANMIRIACGVDGASHADQVQAARLIYDRVLGKPHQSATIEHKQQHGSERVILQQIAVILDRQPDLRAMLTAGEQPDIIDAQQDDEAATDDAATVEGDPHPPQLSA